ncbi:MAG: hypothetical protein PHP55_05230 [Methanoculleus sp.]|nr:hypothetical protein [Methanoculleus sp.]
MSRIPDRVGTFVAIVLLLLAFSAVAAASAVTVYPGSVVTLAGTSTGSDTVYFFVTGPNLPSAGGRLEDPATPVRSGDPASFTAVAVGADDRWTYRWRTGEVGLDPGTYIVYVVDAPVDRSNLPGHGYTTVPVPLGLPPGTPATETAAVPTAMPTEPATPTMPTGSPSPTPTAAAPAAATLMTVGAVLVMAILFSRQQ